MKNHFSKETQSEYLKKLTPNLNIIYIEIFTTERKKITKKNGVKVV